MGDQFKLSKKHVEYGTLALFLLALLWIGPGHIWDHKIDHGYPYGYSAADTFQHQARAAGIATIGNYRYEPIQYFTGDNPEFPGYYPPLLLHLSASLTRLTGMGTHITITGLVFISTILSIGILYFLIRKFNPTIALLSLPLTLFVFIPQTSVNAYTWGHLPQVFGQLFVILVGWVLAGGFNRGWDTLLAIAIIGTVLSYTGHTIMVAFFLIIFVIYTLATKGVDTGFLIRLSAIGVGVFIITSRYLLYFVNIWMGLNPYEFKVMKEWRAGGGVFALADLGWPLWIVVVGIVLGIFMLVKQMQKGKNAVPLLFCISFLALGFTNYVGFGKRALFIRLYWPLYLAIFLGLAIYTVGKQGIKWKSITTASVAVLLGVGILLSYAPPDVGPGMMSQSFWDILTWLRDETPSDSKLAFVYGAQFIGDPLWNVERYHLRIYDTDLADALNNGSVRRHYLSTVDTDSIAYFVVPLDHAKNNPLFWGWTWNGSYDYRLNRYRDICSLDYLIFSGGDPSLTQYGLYIAQKLLEKDWISQAYSNEYGLILRNARPGDTCIENHQLPTAS